MKKYVLYIFLIMFLLLNFSINVYASKCNFDICLSADNTSVNTLENYNVSITYNGANKLNSLSFAINLENASCTITTPGCNTFHCSLNSVNPNTTIVNMKCNNSNNSIASISLLNIHALNTNNQNVSLRSKYLSIHTKTTVPTSSPSTNIATSALMTTEPNTTTSSSTIKKSTKKTTKISATTKTNETVIDEPITAHLEMMPTEKTSELKLKKLKIVNYDIDFKENKKEYTISVPNDLEYLEIVALPVSSDITLNNVGKVDIIDKDKVIIELSKDDVKENYIINIKRIVKKEANLFWVFFILGIGIVSSIICIILISKRNKKHEKEKYLNKVAKEQEDAKKLLEEELEITQTFYNLNKRL